MGQAQTLQCRRGASFDDDTPRVAQSWVREGQHCRFHIIFNVRQHIAHAVVRLVDDSVVVAIERRLHLAIGLAANMHRLGSLLRQVDQVTTVVFGGPAKNR